jgi:carbonic anhydrase
VRAAYDAVTGVAAPTPGLRPIVDRILPSLPGAAADADLDEVSATHVQLTVEQLTRGGIEAAVRSGACAVVGLTYRLAEGRVTVVAAAH